MASDLKEDETTFTHAPSHHISRMMTTGKCLNVSLYLRGEKQLREDNVNRFCSSSPTWESNSGLSTSSYIMLPVMDPGGHWMGGAQAGGGECNAAKPRDPVQWTKQ